MLPPSLAGGRHTALAEVSKAMLFGFATLNEDAASVVHTPKILGSIEYISYCEY